MNKKVLAAFAAVAALTAAALPVAAQTAALKANVPFPFTVGSKAMGAGEYTITQDATAPVIILQHAAEQAGAVAMVAKRGLETPGAVRDTLLVFNRYGDRYFLAEVVDADDATVILLPKTAAERELAKTASVQRIDVLAVMARR